MKIMTWKEFYNSLVFKEDNIYIPILQINIDKSKFITKLGYNVEEQDLFLKEIYNSSLLIKK